MHPTTEINSYLLELFPLIFVVVAHTVTRCDGEYLFITRICIPKIVHFIDVCLAPQIDTVAR